MVFLGLLLVILGFVFGIQLLWIIGLVILLFGLFAGFSGYAGRPIYGRRHWF